MEIIGLSGYARSGKDEAANVLVEEFGFQRVAFADKLREVLYALNPIVKGVSFIAATDGQGGIIKDTIQEETHYSTVQTTIDTYGWGAYKEGIFGPEIRRLLQRLGTEAGRQTLWDSIWVDAAFANVADDAKVVVTDCRFENEAQAITERGGKVWRIHREGVGPATGADGTVHKSETSLDDWKFDRYLVNEGSLEDYHNMIRWAYNESN